MAVRDDNQKAGDVQSPRKPQDVPPPTDSEAGMGREVGHLQDPDAVAEAGAAPRHAGDGPGAG